MLFHRANSPYIGSLYFTIVTPGCKAQTGSRQNKSRLQRHGAAMPQYTKKLHKTRIASAFTANFAQKKSRP